MNIAHLKYAVEVEKTASITKAAENLFMGQPNLSRGIKELEETLGVKIFKRTSKGIVPTPQGEEFLGYAKSILAQIEEMESLYKPEKNNKLKFSISVPRASYIARSFTTFVRSLQNAGELEIDFRETTTLSTITSVAERECKLGIIRYPAAQEEYYLRLLTEKDLQWHQLLEYEPLLLLSAAHPLADRPSICEADLHDSILLQYDDRSGPPMYQDAAPLSAKTICLYTGGSLFDILQDLPNACIWVSPVPKALLERYHLVLRRCQRSAQPVKDCLIYAKGYSFSALDKEFIATLTDTIRELSDEPVT